MWQNRVLNKVLLFIGLFALALFVYRSGLCIPYYQDDFQRVFTHPQNALFQGFITSNPFDHFYRPLEQMFLAAIQIVWKWNTLPIRIIHLLLHASCALLVFHVLRFWRVGILSAIAASVFVVISQASSYAVLSNNTFSQLTGTLFAGLSLWLLYRYLGNKEQRHDKSKYLLSVVFFFLAILSKETIAGLPLGIALLVGVMQDRNMAFKTWLRRIVKQLLPFGACLIIYSLLRIQADAFVPSFSTTTNRAFYSFGVGTNVIRNIGLFVIQIVLPVSSLMAKKALHFRDYSLVVPIGLLTAAFASIVSYGLWKSSKRRIILILGVLLVFSWLPAIFLNHDVGESYGYNMIMYLGVLFGIAFESYRLKSLKKSLWAVISIVFLVSGITNVLGTDEKASSMRSMGDRAEIFLPQILSYAKGMPRDNWIYLINPRDTEFRYTKFSLNWLSVLDFSDNDSTLIYYSNRPDIRMRFCRNLAEYQDSSKTHPGIPFTCDPATLRIYPVEYFPGSVK